MDVDLNGKVAIVTGAASGIGASVAQYFAERGATVVGVDLNQEVPARMAVLPGTGHLGLARDLTDPQAAGEVVSRVVEEVGTPQILVNSAGIGLIDPATDVPASRWQLTLDVNLSGSFYMAQAAGRAMLEAGYGRIVSIASQAAVVGLEQHAAYSASKAGILGFTRVLAMEWARRGVTVNAVSPTIVETPLGREVWAGERGEQARSAIPVGRFATSEEVAALIAFLCTDAAAMITGENVMIDGGFTIV
ncbi:GolD/DthD family dehydrogenase [Psychromicrobium xiongbiense]|uniref:GolD/DthD family dehydrogenase n=1 Tax=Psychromicrobium xiongbiense TaxID=3051184 RepID=UPI0025573EAB|nr:D-threitol dehydrogenase [Psychromicrobium sp. YIM S02556]